MKRAVTVSVDEGLLVQVDRLVSRDGFESRSAALEASIVLLLDAQADQRYEQALAALTADDVELMQSLAEEGMEDWSDIVRRAEW